MKTVGVSVFRENLVSYLKQVQKGTTLVLTSHGKQVAVLTPPDTIRKQSLLQLGILGKTAVIGDSISPVSDYWEAVE